jgi:hypothetical protein
MTMARVFEWSSWVCCGMQWQCSSLQARKHSWPVQFLENLGFACGGHILLTLL